MIETLKRWSPQQIIASFIVVTLLIYQLVRVITFVNVYGGLEHDGGWLLGVSRSLAERGTFTTMVSTIVDPSVQTGLNIDHNLDVQDEEGRIWFYTGNSVGPIVFLVNAFFLKLFGTGFWPLHFGSLLFFTLYLITAVFILWRLGGFVAAMLLMLYLYLYPQLSIFLGYEALGEVPAFLLTLLAYILFMRAIRAEQSESAKWYFICGLVAGLAINTKLLAILSLGGLFVVWLMLWRQRRSTLQNGLALAGGGLVFPLVWEMTHLIVFGWRFSLTAYQQNLQGRYNFILNEGSGLTGQNFSGPRFVWDKALLISEISHPNQILSLLTLLLVAGGGLGLVWLYRQQPQRQQWLILLWIGWLGNSLWFIGLGETGWVRHAWFGLILAVMILCVLVGELFSRLQQNLSPLHLGFSIMVLAILLPGFAAQQEAMTVFISDSLVESWRQKQVAAKYSKVPWIIIPRAEQAQVVNFLQQLPPDSRVFYPASHKAAEIAVQVGKVFYPIERRNYMPPASGDVILIGATLISPWKDPGVRHSLIERARVECPNFLYESPHYIICTQPGM